jgi:hypothetical protein
LGSSQFGLPPFLFTGGGKGKGEERKEGGRIPPFPFPIRPASIGGATPCGLLCSPLMAHIFPPGVPVTPWYSDKYPIQSETLPVSEYYHPIYQSLPLDHFETPRHVRDLIRDSEQHSVTKSHNSYNTISSTNVKRADPTGSRTM